MEIITDTIPLNRLREMAKSRFGDMVKAVVDVDKGNRSRAVEDPQVRQRIMEIVSCKVPR